MISSSSFHCAVTGVDGVPTFLAKSIDPKRRERAKDSHQRSRSSTETKEKREGDHTIAYSPERERTEATIAHERNLPAFSPTNSPNSPTIASLFQQDAPKRYDHPSAAPPTPGPPSFLSPSDSDFLALPFAEFTSIECPQTTC